MNIVILDNFDSFTFNLLDEFSFEQNQVHVWRNNIAIDDAYKKIMSLAKPRLIVLSPGPGHPDDAGIMNELILRLKGHVPIFGVCLGMQAMVSTFGGKVDRAKNIVHGKARLLKHTQELIFAGLEKNIMVARYHSLYTKELPDCFTPLACSEEMIMAIAHKDYPILGIQFHPESILTTYGSHMLKNVISWAKEQQ